VDRSPALNVRRLGHSGMRNRQNKVRTAATDETSWMPESPLPHLSRRGAEVAAAGTKKRSRSCAPWSVRADALADGLDLVTIVDDPKLYR